VLLRLLEHLILPFVSPLLRQGISKYLPLFTTAPNQHYYCQFVLFCFLLVLFLNYRLQSFLVHLVEI